MPRYIDADALREKMFHEAFEKDSQDQKWDSGCWIRYHMFENAVDSIQTADVVEQKVGEWVEGADDYRFMCSVCKCKENVPTVMGKPDWNYCPNCGADMRERREDVAEIHCTEIH